MTRKPVVSDTEDLTTATITRTTRITSHVHDWQAQFTRPIYAHNLQDMHTIYKHTLRAYNLRARPTRKMYVPVLHIQSMRPTYLIRHVIRLSLARTYYTS